MKHNLDEATICVARLGCVDLPVAKAFLQSLRVIAFDAGVKTPA